MPKHRFNERTLSLFQVEDPDTGQSQQQAPDSSSDSDDEGRRSAASSQGADDGLSSKNPRWLAARQKELRGQQLRERAMKLLSSIEEEEAKDKPALSKSWLKDKRMELRKVVLSKQHNLPDSEKRVRGIRRKLRQGRAKAGNDEGLEDGEEEDEEQQEELEEDDTWRRQHAGRMRRRQSEVSSDGSAFDLNPMGRLSRPNPRATVSTADLPSASRPQPKWKKPLKQVGKAAKLPMRAGYKLGQMLQKRRHRNAGTGRRRDSESDSSESSSAAAGGKGRMKSAGSWGQRVHASNASQSSSSRSSSCSSSGSEAKAASAKAKTRKKTLVIQGEAASSCGSEQSLHDLRKKRPASSKSKAAKAAAKLLPRRLLQRNGRSKAGHIKPDVSNHQHREEEEEEEGDDKDDEDEEIDDIPELRPPLSERLRTKFARPGKKGHHAEEHRDHFNHRDNHNHDHHHEAHRKQAPSKQSASQSSSSANCDPVVLDDSEELC